MEIFKNIHQLRVDFQVTATVKRYVYIYLITGKNCYLIDTGTAGSERQIAEYLSGIGRSITDIRAILLTHAHPDHMGSAAAVQRASGCEIYGSAREQTWFEHIDTQFRERPVPGFYSLLRESVIVDHPLLDGERFCPEPGLSFVALETPGHSEGSLTYLLEESHYIFTGDAIPDQNDFPIFSDLPESISSLNKIRSLPDIRGCCPAWDRVYAGAEIKSVLRGAEALLVRLASSIQSSQKRKDLSSDEAKLDFICGAMEWNPPLINPLLKKALQNHIRRFL